jgi:hypothetical protein
MISRTGNEEVVIPRIRKLLLGLAVVLALSGSANGAVISFRLAALSSPSTNDQVKSVPASRTNFALGSSIFLEVWVQTINPSGLSSASLDLSFESSLATAVEVTHSSVFSALVHSLINNPAGFIDDLSGSHLGPCADAVGVSPNWGRVAVVEFTANADGVLTFRSLPSGSPVYGSAICGVGDINPNDISFNPVIVAIGPAAIPATSPSSLMAMSLLILIAGSIALSRAGAQ